MYRLIVLFVLMISITPTGCAKDKSDPIHTSIQMAHVDEALSRDMVASHQEKLHKLLPASSDLILPDIDQSFLISGENYDYYLLPVDYMATESDASHSCGITLFDKSRNLIGAQVTFDYDKLGWSCELILGIGFRRNLSTNVVDIVAIYEGRPPSGEVFNYPVKLVLDPSQNTLDLDRRASDSLNEHNIESVAAGFKLLSIKHPPR